MFLILLTHHISIKKIRHRKSREQCVSESNHWFRSGHQKNIYHICFCNHFHRPLYEPEGVYGSVGVLVNRGMVYIQAKITRQGTLFIRLTKIQRRRTDRCHFVF